MSPMEGEAEELKKKLQTLQQQHNQAYEILKTSKPRNPLELQPHPIPKKSS